VAAKRKAKAFTLKEMFGRKYARKPSEVSAVEKAAGAVIVIALVAIAAGIFAKGRDIDPDMFGLSEESAAKIKGFDGDITLAGPDIPIGLDGKPFMAFARPESGADSAPSLLPLELDAEGWSLAGKTESFTAGNLYEKINGRAELYLAYDMIGLDCASYEWSARPDLFIDVYVYDMGSPWNAFGIYAMERAPNPNAIAIGREGYDAMGSLFFWKGNYYVQVLPSEEKEDVAEVARSIARKIEQQIADPMDPIAGLSLLPSESRIAYSDRYVLRNALSQTFLNHMFTAQYETAGGRLTAFVTVRPSEADAKELFGKYRDALGVYAKTLQADGALGEIECYAADVLGTVDLVFAVGPAFAGVTEAPSLEAAIAFAKPFAQYIKEAAPAGSELPAVEEPQAAEQYGDEEYGGEY
jgi:hypothetical protein